MNRSRQFFQGLGSSWFATLCTVVYSLLSIPIALQYLSVDEFGLFVLLIQIAGYFNLIELGISAAVARILIDYKDFHKSGAYGSVVLTGFMVFAVQGFLILVIGLLTAPTIIAVVGVPSELNSQAVFLLKWLAVASALTITFRTYSSVLYANKRLDLIHIFIAMNTLLGLGLLTLILVLGGGLAGLALLFITQAIVGVVSCAVACKRLELMPQKGFWGSPSVERFRELFSYGKDVFLVNVGNQVLEASQLIIVTRTMGLTAAAVWSVSTKLFTLVYQLVTKIEGTAVVFFAEMMVRGERERLVARFRQVYQLTAAVAVVAVAVMAAVNRPFVFVWANPSLAWEPPLSGLLALLILLSAVTRCSGDLIIHTKDIGAFRYLYFLEAMMFVLLAVWLGAQFGFYGILGSSIVCLLVFRATYTTWRMARYFSLPGVTFWWTWLKRPILAGMILLPFVISSLWLTKSVTSLWGQLFVAVAWVSIPAAITLLFVGLPRDVRNELALRWPKLSLIARY
jgi:O-antigen/teichoic acid export membrane protein